MSQPNPNPNPNPNPFLTDQSTHHHHHHYPTPYSSSYDSHNPNPNPNPSVVTHEFSSYYSTASLGSTLNPPGTEPYSSYSNPAGLYEAYPHYQTVDVVGTSAQAQASAVAVQNWAINQLVQHYGTSALQNGAEQLVAATSNPTMWTTPVVNKPCGPWKKVPKKVKIAQSQFCEVCKITCNSKEVLDKHKTGKKHHKNLELLKAGVAPTATTYSGVPNNPIIGPQEKPSIMGSSLSGQKRIIKAATAEDLDTKKRKIMEAGVASSAVRSCGICNVVCNSETVFKTHLVGHKHIAMLKKLTGGTG